MEGGNSLCLAIVNGDVSYAGWKAGIGRQQYEPVFACRALAMTEDEGRARTGHLKRDQQERGYISRLGALRAAKSKEIVPLLLFGRRVRRVHCRCCCCCCCWMRRLETRKGRGGGAKKRNRRSSVSTSAESTFVVNGWNCGGTQKQQFLPEA